MSIPGIVDAVSDRIAVGTAAFIETRMGKMFLSLILLGPFTFLPTVYQAWTSPDIEALRTLTWPMMLLTNSAGLLAVIHCGNWRVRLVSVIWSIMIALVYIATLVR